MAILLTSIVGFYTYRQFVPPKIIAPTHVSQIVFTTDLREIAAVTPYIFIAYIEETYDVNATKFYRQHPESILEFVREDYGFTECTVKVIQNIKGELQMDAPVTLYHVAGYSKDLLMIRMYDGDFLPEKGKYYLYMANTYEDGTLVAGGTNSYSKLLEEGIARDNLNESKIYQEYVEAYNSRYIGTKELRERFENNPKYVSVYDKKYNGERGQLQPRENLASVPSSEKKSKK